MTLIRLSTRERDDLLAASRAAADPEEFAFERVAWFGSYTIRVAPDARDAVAAALPPESTLRAKLRAKA